MHHRAAEIHGRIRQIRSTLKHNRERLLFDYICDNTLGRGKASDPIANSQFIRGKRCRKTGQEIDFGCGLKSINTVRAARKSLVAQGIIFEEAQSDEYGANNANRYGLVFLRDLLELQTTQTTAVKLKRHTRRGYQSLQPTNTPKEMDIQRCTTPNKSAKRHFYKDPEHVDYIVDEIEKATQDKHSRGAFAQIALTVDEGQIFELLSLLKDRENIRNKGAWFFKAASRYQRKQIIRADDPAPAEQPQTSEKTEPQPLVSPKQWLKQNRPNLVKSLDAWRINDVSNLPIWAQAPPA